MFTFTLASEREEACRYVGNRKRTGQTRGSKVHAARTYSCYPSPSLVPRRECTWEITFLFGDMRENSIRARIVTRRQCERQRRRRTLPDVTFTSQCFSCSPHFLSFSFLFFSVTAESDSSATGLRKRVLRTS